MDFNNTILVKDTPPSPPKFFYIDTGTDEGLLFSLFFITMTNIFST